MTSRVRSVLALAWVVLAVAGAAGVMWWQDGQYGQPTARPAELRDAPVGQAVEWPAEVAALLEEGKPAWLHFYNPGCPCSRFNLELVGKLAREHAGHADLVLVMEAEDAPTGGGPLADVRKGAVHDADGSIADLAGVYSTPVAVMLDAEHRVVYVGNYTETLYCNNPLGQPVESVLARMLDGAQAGPLEIEAPVPFGCPLPSDVREARP